MLKMGVQDGWRSVKIFCMLEAQFLGFTSVLHYLLVTRLCTILNKNVLASTQVYSSRLGVTWPIRLNSAPTRLQVDSNGLRVEWMATLHCTMKQFPHQRHKQKDMYGNCQTIHYKIEVARSRSDDAPHIVEHHMIESIPHMQPYPFVPHCM